MRISHLAFPLLLLLIFISNLLFAAELPVFKEKIPLSIKESIAAILPEDDINQYAFAPVDLNRDGLDELILKQKECADMCEFKILGLTKKDKPLILLDIEAKSVLASDRENLGIRDILVHDHPGNDFATSLYIWDTQSSRYILKK